MTFRIEKEKTSGVLSATKTPGVNGQEDGKKRTAAVDPKTLPVWRGSPVKPGGIGGTAKPKPA
jgi:hypothetical protein